MTAPDSSLMRVEASLPPGVELPTCLARLCEYLDAHGYPLSGCFELGTVEGDAEGWFPGDSSMQQQVAIFGRGSSGSSFALWLSHAPDPNSAPVVVLGDQGNHRALATTPLEFCRLLGCGYEEVEFDDLTQVPVSTPEAESLRKWLDEELGVQAPATGHAITAAAEERFPGFEAWVTDWQDAHL